MGSNFRSDIVVLFSYIFPRRSTAGIVQAKDTHRRYIVQFHTNTFSAYDLVLLFIDSSSQRLQDAVCSSWTRSSYYIGSSLHVHRSVTLWDVLILATLVRTVNGSPTFHNLSSLA